MKKQQPTKITSEACKACKAHCCMHVALPIGNPRSKQDYDFIRWYLMHQDIHVYVDNENDWMIEFKTPCMNLDKNYQCKVYSTRPKICRDFPPKGELCEYFDKRPAHKMIFTNSEEFEAYLTKKKKSWTYKK